MSGDDQIAQTHWCVILLTLWPARRAWGREPVQKTGLVAGRISSMQSSSTCCRSAEDQGKIHR